MLDETTYYITAFAVDSNNAVISSQQTTITTDFGWHPSANTLLYYEFENSIVDLSGKGNNPTTQTYITFENVGGQMVAKNTSSSATLAISNTIYNMGLGDFTISMFFYVNTTLSDPGTQLCSFANSSNSNKGPGLRYGGNGQYKIRARMYGQGSDQEYHLGPTCSSMNQKWNHLVFTRKSNVCRFIVNGVLYDTWNDSTNVPYPDDSRIFFRGDYGQNPAGSKVDKFIYEKVSRETSNAIKYFNKYKSLYGIS